MRGGGDQKITCQSWFSPSAIRIWRPNFRSSGLAASEYSSSHFPGPKISPMCATNIMLYTTNTHDLVYQLKYKLGENSTDCT